MKLILKHSALGTDTVKCDHIEVGKVFTIELVDDQGTSALALTVSETMKRILYNHNIDWDSEVDSYTD